ncbi:MAG: beta-phosphoglucomutase family hydrolase [Planctomycetota bacterium]
MPHLPDLHAFDGLIFDCDGTLIDTMPAHYRAWSETMEAYGIHFPEDRFYALGGVPAHRIVATLAAEQGVELDAWAVAHEKEDCFEQRHTHDVVPIEPVMAIARAHHGRVPLAVATGGLRRIIEPMLADHDVHAMFDAVVTADDVEHHKPAPDTYLLAAERIGVDPARCCAFEDTDLGMQAIRAAGMNAVDIRPIVEHHAKAG